MGTKEEKGQMGTTHTIEDLAELLMQSENKLASTLMLAEHVQQVKKPLIELSTSQKETIERLRETLNRGIKEIQHLKHEYKDKGHACRFLNEAEQLLNTTEPIDQ